MAKNISVGDTVRYLNATGGGVVVRIAGDLAYVDEDGFETPVLCRECVAVASNNSFTPPSYPVNAGQKPKAAAPEQKKDCTPTIAPHVTQLPIVETAEGDTMNLVLACEPVDIKALSRSDFDISAVNDSNYYLYVAVMIRSAEQAEWTLKYDGCIEPNIQEYLFTLEQSELSHFDRLCVAWLPFKRQKSFAMPHPGAVEIKVDATKFAKLHCFRPNEYFETPVICFDVVRNGRAVVEKAIDAEALAAGLHRKASDAPRRHDKRSTADDPNKPLEVDLHASVLFETTAGLSPSEILNFQVDHFRSVMDNNLRNAGRKIIFIHGKGDGVLRQALMKELTHRYKGHDVQDASFREYGFGATQVTIRQQQRKK